jgi:hypothetical protein
MLMKRTKPRQQDRKTKKKKSSSEDYTAQVVVAANDEFENLVTPTLKRVSKRKKMSSTLTTLMISLQKAYEEFRSMEREEYLMDLEGNIYDLQGNFIGTTDGDAAAQEIC